jgi:hypothetical protein
VRKEISSQHPAKVISSQPSPMVIRGGSGSCFIWAEHVSTTHSPSVRHMYCVLKNKCKGLQYVVKM